MKKFFVLAPAILALVGSACATRGYARRQAAKVNDRVTEVQGQIKGYSDKHDTDLARVDARITATDNKAQAAAASAAQANANAALASASAARADASAAGANASAARSETTAALANAKAAQDAANSAQDAAKAAQDAAKAAQERSELAQNTKDAPAKPPSTLPTTGSPFPLIGLSGLLSLGVGGVLRLFRR